MRPTTRQLRGFLAVAGVLAGTSLPVDAQVSAEPGRPLAAVIDGYVREGLKSNLGLRAQSLEVERAEAALDAARARYFPEAGFAARYTRAEGGRTIELPLGDALNPAYQTLNDLLVQQGQQPQFPVVQNETINFLREREQDTRITLRMPLIAPAIPAAVRAQRELLGASEYSRQAFGRRLSATSRWAT
jgi:outer membrane protein